MKIFSDARCVSLHVSRRKCIGQIAQFFASGLSCGCRVYRIPTNAQRALVDWPALDWPSDSLDGWLWEKNLNGVRDSRYPAGRNIFVATTNRYLPAFQLKLLSDLLPTESFFPVEIIVCLDNSQIPVLSVPSRILNHESPKEITGQLSSHARPRGGIWTEIHHFFSSAVRRKNPSVRQPGSAH